jgi:hypothetical protein
MKDILPADFHDNFLYFPSLCSSALAIARKRPLVKKQWGTKLYRCFLNKLGA